MPQNTHYLARRARFLQGMTQSQFAEEFGVDVSTVSRWERGIMDPAPQHLVRLRDINAYAIFEEAAKASPVMKYVAHVKDLTHPVHVSKGWRQAIERLGYRGRDLQAHFEEVQPATPEEHSALRALELIQQDPLWIKRRVVYAEAHCLTRNFGWVDGVVAPIHTQGLALVEWAKSLRADEEGFWVHLVRPTDLK
jgi:transcriptional regulator with XRE-family HTH domain